MSSLQFLTLVKMMTKALVIGYGSIGRRHVNILRGMGCDVSIVSRHQSGVAFFNFLSEAFRAHDFDYVVVANETSLHAEMLSELVRLKYSRKLLVEKPIFTSGSSIPVNQFETFAVAYNLRFNLALQALAMKLNGQKIISAQLYVGQYLPYWRPDSDYKKSYSASSEKGGGVLRDLSHELDIALWLFGDVVKVSAIGGRLSSLEIDSDDSWGVLGVFSACPLVTLQLNYLDRIVKREIVVNTEGNTYHLDLLTGSLNCNGDISSFKAKRDATYLAQHEAILAGDLSYVCNAESGLKVLKLIEEIERSACKIN